MPMGVCGCNYPSRRVPVVVDLFLGNLVMTIEGTSSYMVLLVVIAGLIIPYNNCISLLLSCQFLHDLIHVHFYRGDVNKFSYYLNLLEEAESQTVTDASFVLKIPPEEIMWLGWRDFPEVDPTNDFIATPVTFYIPFYL